MSLRVHFLGLGSPGGLDPVRIERSRGFSRPEIRHIQQVVAERARGALRGLTISDNAVSVDLADRRTITAPLPGFHASHMGLRLSGPTGVFIGNGEGIHWPDLDEDISVQRLLAGRQSGESQSSLRRWLDEQKR